MHWGGYYGYIFGCSAHWGFQYKFLKGFYQLAPPKPFSFFTLNCLLELTSGSFLTDRRDILVIPKNHQEMYLGQIMVFGTKKLKMKIHKNKQELHFL